MEIFEITGYQTGVSRAGVNFLQPADSYQNIKDGFIYRQVLQSRQGVGYFCDRLENNSRITGIFEHTLPDGTKELLATDLNFLYKYNTTSGNFDKVPFAGALAGYAGFNISDYDFYISGTSYPTFDNLPRFVFTGLGISPAATGSSIFFYDGTNVLDFTDVGDNPKYAQPTMGVLTVAKYVVWFNERLNFIVPSISPTEYLQGILYSGIRDSSGNGDKFNVAGSGLLQADTYETINGINILGQELVINFDRSNWVAVKTTDAFNPYFIRKIPSVLGTNADFSAVSWNDTVKSVGKTGIISTDGRQSLRSDNKIPYFTADEIEPLDFNQTYGGFDRLNNQFLWTYVNAGSESDTQNKVLVNNYEEDTWSVFNLRLTVFGQTDLGLNLAWDDIDETSGNESWSQWDTTEEIWNKIGVGLSVQKTLAGDDLGFIYELNQDNDDYFIDITGATNANFCVMTVGESAFQVGDKVVVQSVVGMLDSIGNSGINNYDPAIDSTNFVPYTVTAATSTSVTINLNTTSLTAYGSGGTLSKLIEFEAETIPFNPYRDQGKRCYVSHVEFLLDIREGGYLKVDVYQDEEEAPYKSNVLIKPTEGQQRRQWITLIVDNEANFHTFVMKQASPAVRMKLTSMRIHAAPGGYTSG